MIEKFAINNMQDNIPINGQYPKWYAILQLLDKLPENEWIDSHNFAEFIDQHYPQYFDNRVLKRGKYRNISDMLSYLSKWNLATKKVLSAKEKKELFAGKRGWCKDENDKWLYRGRLPDFLYQISEKGKRYVRNYHKYRNVCPTCNRLIYKITQLH